MAVKHRVTLLPGDSIGPEICRAALRLGVAAGVDIAWEEVACGRGAVEAGGEALPAGVIAAIEDTRVALKGRLDTPVGAGYESPNVRLRKELGLYAVVRPIKSQPGVPSRYDDVDLTIVREATEDVYTGIEHEIAPGIVQSIKVTTRKACERIVRHAFAVARREGRDKVTLVHKANIMKRADGLFLEVGREVAKEHSDIAFDSIFADNACMQLVKRPSQFGVLVAQNLFGDLLSDLGAGLVGGPSNIWGKLENDSDIVVFEAIHQLPADPEPNTANPLPFIRPLVALLHHLEENEAATRIEGAVASALQGGTKPFELGGEATTEGFVDRVIELLGS
jgi:isocitrate dehydrogenase (NAD+)